MMRSCLVLIVLGGCTRTSARYCELHTDDTANCPAPDAPPITRCMTSNDCAATPGTLVCDVPSQTCVQCNAASSQSSACIGVSPVCGDTMTCRGCRTHLECPSGACLPDGSCGTDQNVAFVDGSVGGGSTTCTQASPCDKITDGLAATPPRAYIKVRGSIDENVTITNRDVTILAEAGARLYKGTSTLLTVAGSSNVTIYDLQVGAMSPASTTGIDLDAPTGSLTLHHASVVNNVNEGIRANMGTLNVYRSTIADNSGGGIHVRNTATAYDIRNNFIHSNGRGTGSNATLYGGLLLEMTPGKVEFNTVAYNQSDGLQNVPGIACFGSANSATGNIAFSNRIAFNTPLDDKQAFGSCQFGSTYKLGMGDLHFANNSTSTPDLHLTVDSPSTVRDAGGTCGASNPEDIDADSRPYGLGCDLGADELSP